MILGFAHVMVGCHFNGNFNGVSVPSSKEKWPLMVNKPLKHDIVVGFPENNYRLVPIELVEHETGFAYGRPKITVFGRSWIGIQARNADLEKRFFLTLGEDNCGLISVKSSLPKWVVDISVVENCNAPIDPPLDINGNVALAFYSTDAEDDKDRLMRAGGRMATNPFAMHINGKSMLVCMLRSPEGTIIELIQMRGRV